MNSLQLCPITVNDDYKKEWNVHPNDFLLLTKNGEVLRNTLYRIGGCNFTDFKKDRYFLLLKYVEAYYSKDILKMSKSNKPKHLDGRWCILDSEGNEKKTMEPFKHPHIIKDSCIYSIDGKYYNIETDELYCDSQTKCESKDYLFLENKYDNDITKRGVMKINKTDGSWELFPL